MWDLNHAQRSLSRLFEKHGVGKCPAQVIIEQLLDLTIVNQSHCALYKTITVNDYHCSLLLTIKYLYLTVECLSSCHYGVSTSYDLQTIEASLAEQHF